MSSKRKRVLFLLPSLAGGGAERVFSSLLRHLDHDHFELHLAVLNAGGAYWHDVPDHVAIHDLKISRVRYALPSVVRLVWTLRPHTILSTLGYMNLVLILGKPLLPRFTKVLVRETTMISTFLQEETKHPRFWGRVYRYLYGRASKVVCSSEAMVNDMVEHLKVPREKLVRIYNPLDVESVRRCAKIGGNPYRGRGPHLIAAGRLSREKGFDILLDAMPMILEHFPNAQLAILGEGPSRAQLMRQAEGLGLNEEVQFLGFEQNPWRYIGNADLFVLPSRYEGLPNVLLEALALGVRVVAADCPGAIREIQASGAEMVLVPQENPVALAEAIVSICRSPKISSDLSTISPPVLRNFELQRIIGEYSELF
jgi:glycosyltransferase involved in cell wall biosynthesis